jgi:tRNA(Ile)-lysidine synthase
MPDAGPARPELDVATLADVPPALRRRVLRAWLALAGVTGLTDAHLRAADVLAARGPDRAGVAVPGGLELNRAHGRLGIRPVRWSSAR